jgi:hypothetical protein
MSALIGFSSSRVGCIVNHSTCERLLVKDGKEEKKTMSFIYYLIGVTGLLSA